MKKAMVAVLFGCLACHSGFAQLPGLDVFEVGDVKRITLGDTGSNVVAHVMLTFTNKTEFDLKLRSGDFKICAVPKKGDKILVGTSRVTDLLLPGKASGQPPKDEELVLVLGSDRNDVIRKLSALLLAIANGKDQMKTVLEGECEIGIKKGNAWQYVKGITFEFDLDPNVNWDVLWDKTAKGGITISFGKDTP